MSTPDFESSTLSESIARLLNPTLNNWAQIKLDDEFDENDVRARIQSLVRDIRCPWTTVELIPPSMESVVMDVLQQELDNVFHSDGYLTACMKCLRALSKARNIVPSCLFLRDVIREGENPVAGGGFADIWKGRLQDTQVCLKVLRVFGTEGQKAKVLRHFCQEALVWRQLRHPNILPFLGISEDLFAPRYCLISSWIVNGNIVSYLEAHPDHDRLTSLVQVAEGMKYLHNHNPPIVHADIRGANIFVMDDLCCCLADFGLSLFAESQALESSSRMSKGSTRWLAPEYIIPNGKIDPKYVTARDIYAYGCTVVEIFTGKPPFSDIKNEAAVIHAVMTGSRQLRPQHLLQDRLWSLVTTCLITSPSQRPTAEQISKILQIKPCQEAIGGGNITAMFPPLRPSEAINLLEDDIKEVADMYNEHKNTLDDCASFETDLNRLELAALELKAKYIQGSLNVSWVKLPSRLSHEKYAWATARVYRREVGILKSWLELAIIKVKKGHLQTALGAANDQRENQATRLTNDASTV